MRHLFISVLIGGALLLTNGSSTTDPIPLPEEVKVIIVDGQTKTLRVEPLSFMRGGWLISDETSHKTVVED